MRVKNENGTRTLIEADDFIGGRNLVLNSGKEYSNNGYRLTEYWITNFLGGG